MYFVLLVHALAVFLRMNLISTDRARTAAIGRLRVRSGLPVNSHKGRECLSGWVCA